MLRNICAGRRRTVTQRRDRDLLEPRRDALGRRRSPCATCCVPRPDTPPAPSPPTTDPDYLSTRGGAPARRRRRPLRAVRPALRRRAVDADRGHRGRVDRGASSPPEPVAVLDDPRARRRPPSSALRAGAGRSTRWPSTRGTPPTSSARSATSTAPARRPTTRARRTGSAYALGGEAAAAQRASLGAGARAGFRALNRYVEWHRLPLPLGLLNLDAFRARAARSSNLHRHRAARGAADGARPVPPAPPDEDVRAGAQLSTAPHNDLSAPDDGRGRLDLRPQPAPDYRPDLFDEPNPVDGQPAAAVPRARSIPARSLNILAAAWIQFQVHDWVDHARHPLGERRRRRAAARPA